MNSRSFQSRPYIARRLTILQILSIVIIGLLAVTYYNLQASIVTSEKLMVNLLRAEEIVRDMQTQMHVSAQADTASLLVFLKDESDSLGFLHQAALADGLGGEPLTEKRGQMLKDIGLLIETGIASGGTGKLSDSSLVPVVDGIVFSLDSLYENVQAQQAKIRSVYSSVIGKESDLMGLLLLACCGLLLFSVRVVRTRVLAPVALLADRCREATGQGKGQGNGQVKLPQGLTIHDDEIGHALEAVDSLHRYLKEVNEELNQQVAYKTNFVSQISHEIRTPINSIVGLCQIALNEQSETKALEALRQINRSAKYLTSLVNQVLDYQKMAGGKLVLQHEVVNVDTLLEGLVNAFEHQAQRKGIGFFVSKSQNAPSAFVGDQTRIEQILFNLTSNAIKFTSKGFVTVGFAIQGGRVVLSVKDTGLGISEEEITRLFEPFYQTSSGVKFGTGGTGLGLTLSMNLARLMSGNIEVSSEVRKGSVFTLDLPYEAASVTVAASPQEADPIAGLFNRRLRVLVVDDHSINLKVNSTLLRNAGFQTFVARSGEDAVAMVLDRFDTEESFDAVLMDVHLEGISGIDAVRQIKAALPAGDCPVIVPLTAGITPEETEEMIAMGVTEVLPKPFEVAHAKRLIYDMVYARRAAKEAQA